MYLGDYIVIEEQTGPFSFACCSVSTGTPFFAEVDEDKRHLFSDHAWIDARPNACRFLRPDGDLIRCTIHRDSPPQCKFYRCVVMRILDASGDERGFITGTLALHSDDVALRTAYDEAMRGIRDSEPGAEERLREFLEKDGYRTG
jgi:Fe-S-cluster containining protein